MVSSNSGSGRWPGYICNCIHLCIIRTTLVGPNANDLTYMLAWESLADREKKWNAFFADPEWLEARADSEKDGQINAKVSSSFLTPTKFSATQ